MKTIATKAIASAAILAGLAGTASAQQTLNIDPGPGVGINPPPISNIQCAGGAIQHIAVDVYGRQIITCIYPQPRPINPVGAIIGGIVGGIIAGGKAHH